MSWHGTAPCHRDSLITRTMKKKQPVPLTNKLGASVPSSSLGMTQSYATLIRLNRWLEHLGYAPHITHLSKTGVNWLRSIGSGVAMHGHQMCIKPVKSSVAFTHHTRNRACETEMHRKSAVASRSQVRLSEGVGNQYRVLNMRLSMIEAHESWLATSGEKS